MQFVLKCSEFTAENNKRNFLKTSVKYSLQSNQKWTVIQDCWMMISQDLVDTAIDQFSERLTLVIRAQGGHIEHRLN